MPPQKTLAEKVDEFRRDLDRIAQLMEQLKREYDLWFAGARKRQPFDQRQNLEHLLRKWQTTNIQKLELTFRLQTLQSKYRSMVDIWEKLLKRRETDPHAMTPYGPTAARIAAAMAAERGEIIPPEGAASTAAQAAQAARERAEARTGPADGLRGLFDQFVDAKKDLGESSSLSYEKFAAQLEKQRAAIRNKTQCRDVQFQVVRRGGKVSLTAKPIRD